AGKIFACNSNIMDMDGFALQDCAACNQPWHYGHLLFVDPLVVDPGGTMTGGKFEPFSLSVSNTGIMCVTKSTSGADDCGQHRLQVKLRSPYHPEYVADCSLIFKRLPKLTCASLDFLEQPCVFNRDYSLVREGIDELDLAVGEWAHFRAPD